MPSETELASYYASEYRLDYKGVLVPRKKHVLRAGRLARERLRTLASFLKPGDTLLDLGAGGGEFVGVALAAGFAARGLEPNGGYAGYAATVLGLPVQQGTWQDARVQPDSLHAVTMFHVLEHLPNPVGCLRRVLEWLRPEGWLLVEVPNLIAPIGTRSRRFHRAHLVHFTPETLAATLHIAGFEVQFSDAPGDGGNALTLARKLLLPADASTPAPDVGVSSAGSLALQILSWEKSRGLQAALLAPRLWRFSKRLFRMAEEPVTTFRFRDGKAILDALYRGTL